MKWLTDKELTEPGWYWKCWKDGDNTYHLLCLTKIGITYINELQKYIKYESNLYYYGPLECPPPPTGDVWGV